ncbi:hypothetical protein N8I77_007986 [Diaporthe amygdali]|uniref:Uncharacterized protein n=1 Tax=Phomopsis amygdali TaxID=1214568 RepID=A0AAD9SCW4_PHOAM|nr:hypothetical protein N8I77_007986 [Diaporthe amygdali]
MYGRPGSEGGRGRTSKDGGDSLVDGSDLPLLEEVAGEQSYYEQHDEDEEGPRGVDLLLGCVLAVRVGIFRGAPSNVGGVAEDVGQHGRDPAGAGGVRSERGGVDGVSGNGCDQEVSHGWRHKGGGRRIRCCCREVEDEGGVGAEALVRLKLCVVEVELSRRDQILQARRSPGSAKTCIAVSQYRTC